MTRPVLHRVAGLTLAADSPVAGLAAAPANDPPDVSFHFGAPAPWSSQPAAPYFSAEQANGSGRPLVVVTRSRGGFHFLYADDTAIWVDRDGAHVWCTWRTGSTPEDTSIYLTGPILGFVLRLRGSLALHASAVRIGDAALVLVGPRGAGKSTAAAALGVRGCPVIADDVVHVRPAGRAWMAEPFEGNLKVWESGAALALGATTPLPKLTPTWDKRALRMGTHGIQPAIDPVPVSAAVFLDPRDSARRAPLIEPISPADALVRFATHTSASCWLDARTRAREFLTLDRLVREVVCARGVSAASPARFAAFIDLLLAFAEHSATHRAF